MFECFSEHGPREVVRGWDEARHPGHEYVGNEHVLITVADSSDAPGGALAAVGVSPERAQVIAESHPFIAGMLATSFRPCARALQWLGDRDSGP